MHGKDIHGSDIHLLFQFSVQLDGRAEMKTDSVILLLRPSPEEIADQMPTIQELPVEPPSSASTT